MHLNSRHQSGSRVYRSHQRSTWSPSSYLRKLDGRRKSGHRPRWGCPPARDCTWGRSHLPGTIWRGTVHGTCHVLGHLARHHLSLWGRAACGDTVTHGGVRTPLPACSQPRGEWGCWPRRWARARWQLQVNRRWLRSVRSPRAPASLCCQARAASLTREFPPFLGLLQDGDVFSSKSFPKPRRDGKLVSVSPFCLQVGESPSCWKDFREVEPQTAEPCGQTPTCCPQSTLCTVQGTWGA